MKSGNAKQAGRITAGFTLAEVLIALLLSIVLGALVANLGFSMTQTARQSSLDRQAESIYESASRNLTSISIAGDLDALREGGTPVWNKFDGITTNKGSTDATPVRNYDETYDNIVNILENSAAVKSSGSNSSNSLSPMADEDDSNATDDNTDDSTAGGAQDNEKWESQAERIAEGIASSEDTNEAGVTNSNFTIYRLTSSDSGEAADKAKEVLLEAGVISPDVMDDTWCLFYAVDNNFDYASIMEVWYTTPEYASKLEGDYKFERIVDVGTQEGVDDTAATEETRATMRTYDARKSNGDGHLGYYGARKDALAALPSAQLGDPSEPQCWLVITNAEKLVAHLYCYIPENSKDYYDAYDYVNFAYTLDIEGLTSKGTYQLTGENIYRSKISGSENGFPVVEDGETRGYYYHLDNLVLDGLDRNESFSRFDGLIPGEDIRLKLGVTTVPSDGDQTQAAQELPQATVTVNSLFESVAEDEDDAFYTARVAYGRHLQNLDPAVSGLGIATGANAGDGKRLNVVQTQNIYFNGEDGTGDYSKLGDSWADDLERWAVQYGSTQPVTPSEGEGAEGGEGGEPSASASPKLMTFSPIVNPNIASYSASSESGAIIEGLAVDYVNDVIALHRTPDSSRLENAGLFGTFSGEKISGITLVDPVINGGETCANAGGIVGKVLSSDLSIESCGLHMSALADGSVAADGVDWLVAATNMEETPTHAGGLVGYAIGNVSVDKSYAATVVEATGSDSYAGGLVGKADGSVTLSGSYADCYVGAKRVGGLVGTVQDSFTMAGQCYSAGFALGESVVEAGKFIARSDVRLSGDSLKDSYSVFSFTDPISKHEPASFYDNGAASPSSDTGADPGNGYYLASFEEGSLDTWPYPSLDLTHYGDWNTDYEQHLLLQVVNQEALSVSVDFSESGFTNTDIATITMYGLTSGKETSWTKTVNEFTTSNTIILDSLYTSSGGSGERFVSQFGGAGFLPGENILLTLTVKREDQTVYPSEARGEDYIGYITNSLFAYGKDYVEYSVVKANTLDALKDAARTEDAESVVSGPKTEFFRSYIAYGRHLQNLDHGEFSFEEFNRTGGLGNIATDVPNTAAEQLQDIDFGEGSSWRQQYGDKDFASIFSSDPTIERQYVSIGSYDGKGKLIKNLNLRSNYKTEETPFYVGLFGQFGGELLKDIYLVNAKVSSEDAMVAGALVGSVESRYAGASESLIVDGCRSYLEDYNSTTPLISAGFFVGGLIGRGPRSDYWFGVRPLEINNSFASSIVAVTFDDEPDAACGGLIGTTEFDTTPLKISNSYADCYLIGSDVGQVGGLVGYCSEGGIFENCYSAGVAVKYGQAAGLAPQKASAVKNCYSALYYDSAEGRSSDIYGLVTDVDGATVSPENPELNAEFNGASTASYYTFKGVNADSVVWSNAEGSLFNYVKGEHLKDYLTSGFVTSGQSTPYNLLGNRSDETLTEYPYPTLEGLPHYGDWLEKWSLDLTGYDLKVHLQAPLRGDLGKIQTNADGSIKKYELGEVLYRSDNLTDFITVINPYYLAYLYEEQDQAIPEYLNDLTNAGSRGQFLTVDAQAPQYPDPSVEANGELIEKLSVGAGSVGAEKSGALETSANDSSVLSGIDDVVRTVIPDADSWNGNRAVSRYFLIPANVSEKDFFTTARVGNETADDRLYRQTYRDSDDKTVFFAGYGNGSSTAQAALEQKRSGFGDSMGKTTLNGYIDSYGSNAGIISNVSSTGFQLKREHSAQSGRQIITKYTGECNAYLEWCPKVTLKTVDPSYVSDPMGDFKTNAQTVQQYVTDRQGRYLDSNGGVVSGKDNAATKDAELHYANFSTEHVSGAYFADASMSSASLVREQASGDSVDAFLARYKGFSSSASSGGNKVLESEEMSNGGHAWFLGFGFDADENTFGQVYNNRGMVPQAVVNGSRYIDRDYNAYAHYGYAVTLKMRLPVRLANGTQLHRLTDAVSVTETDEFGTTTTRDVRYYLREGSGEGLWQKVDKDTFEDVGDEIALEEEPSLAFTDQVVGYVYYNSRNANLSTNDITGYGGNVKGYSYNTDVVGSLRGAVLGASQIAPDKSSIESLWGLSSGAGPASGFEQYQFIASFDTNEDETVITKVDVSYPRTFLVRSRSGNESQYVYAVNSNQLFDGDTLKVYRNPETRETSAYAYWGTSSFSYDDYDMSSLSVGVVTGGNGA